MADLPTEPVPPEEWKPYMTPEVASEQHCLRELGFKGKLPLEDKIKGCYATMLKVHNETGSSYVTTMGGVKQPQMRRYLKSARLQLGMGNGNLVFWQVSLICHRDSIC